MLEFWVGMKQGKRETLENQRQTVFSFCLLPFKHPVRTTIQRWSTDRCHTHTHWSSIVRPRKMICLRTRWRHYAMAGFCNHAKKKRHKHYLPLSTFECLRTVLYTVVLPAPPTTPPAQLPARTAANAKCPTSWAACSTKRRCCYCVAILPYERRRCYNVYAVTDVASEKRERKPWGCKCRKRTI